MAVTVLNTETVHARPRITISAGDAHFALKERDPFTCPDLSKGEKCVVHVVYHPSKQAEDTGTLLVKDTHNPSNHATDPLRGPPWS